MDGQAKGSKNGCVNKQESWKKQRKKQRSDVNRMLRRMRQLKEGWKRGRNRLKKIVKCIRNYNSALAFASVGATTSLTPGNGPYCFRIHGQVYRNTSALSIKHHVEKSSYAQLYFIEAEQAIKVNVFYEVKRAWDRN